MTLAIHIDTSSAKRAKQDIADVASHLRKLGQESSKVSVAMSNNGKSWKLSATSMRALSKSLKDYEMKAEMIHKKSGTTMAMFSKIERSVRSYEEALVRANNAMTRLGTTKNAKNIIFKPTFMDRVGSAARSMGMQFVGAYLGVSMLMRGMNAIVETAKHSVESFREFETTLSEVRTLMSVGESASVVGLGAGIEDLSIRYGMPIRDLTEGMYEIISAAVPTEKALNFLTTSTKAAIAGLSDVATSVDILTSVLNAYGMQTEQMTEVSDKLFMTIKRGKLRFEDLANAMGYIAPIAANLGVEFDEVLASLSTVTRQGLHADMATRGLALAFQNISNLAPIAANAAAKYGVDLSGTALRVKGLEYVINELREASEKYGMSVIPEMIRNMRSLRVVMALIGDEGVKGFREDMELLEESIGRTDKALADMMGTTQKWKDVSTQAFEDVIRDIGSGFAGIDIAIEKMKTWWAALFAGKNPYEVVGYVNERLRDAMVSEMAQYAYSPKDISTMSQSEIMMGGSAYIKATRGIEAKSTLLSRLQILRDYAKGLESVGASAKSLDVFSKSIENVNAELSKAGIGTLIGINGISLSSDLNYKMIMTDMDNIIKDLNDELTENTRIVTENTSAYNTLINPFQTAMESYETTQNDIREVNKYLGELGEQIEKYSKTRMETFYSSFRRMSDMVVNYGDDMTSFTATITGINGIPKVIDMYEEEARAIWEIVAANNDYSGSFYDVLNSMRELTSQQKELNEQTSTYNRLLSENSLAQMQLQLKGMLSRHGLRRGDQIKQKKLQIEALRIRMQMTKQKLDVGDTTSDSISKYNEMIREFFDRWSLHIDAMKGLYKEDYTELSEMIENKKELIDDYTETLKEKQRDLLKFELDIIAERRRLFNQMTPEEYQYITGETKASRVLKDVATGRVPIYQALSRWGVLSGQFARGTFSVPSNGLYMLHGGEEVVPKGSQRHGVGSIEVNVAPITVNARISQDVDIKSLGSKIGEAIASGIISDINSEFEVG